MSMCMCVCVQCASTLSLPQPALDSLPVGQSLGLGEQQATCEVHDSEVPKQFPCFLTNHKKLSDFISPEQGSGLNAGSRI
jgi:hypothetical protein